MALRLERDDVSAIERQVTRRRGFYATWVLGLADPETGAPGKLKELILGRGMNLTDDATIAVDPHSRRFWNARTIGCYAGRRPKH